jgi:hypothetical protein
LSNTAPQAWPRVVAFILWIIACLRKRK